MQISLRSALLAIALVAIAITAYRYAFPPPPEPIPVLNATGTYYYFRAFGEEYEVRVPPEALKRSPAWDRRRPHPPLSPNVALVKADQLRLRWIKEGKLPEHYKSDGVWHVEEVKLVPGDKDHWYWQIQFVHEVSQSGPLHELIVPVLMDGTVVEPIQHVVSTSVGEEAELPSSE
jgi:hypothetical protein